MESRYGIKRIQIISRLKKEQVIYMENSNMAMPKSDQEATRIAVLGIIIEDRSQVSQVNDLLHQYAPYIIGRMGLPYEKKQMNIISLVVDAPPDKISALSGRLGRLSGVTSKALYSKY